MIFSHRISFCRIRKVKNRMCNKIVIITRCKQKKTNSTGHNDIMFEWAKWWQYWIFFFYLFLLPKKKRKKRWTPKTIWAYGLNVFTAKQWIINIWFIWVYNGAFFTVLACLLWDRLICHCNKRWHNRNFIFTPKSHECYGHVWMPKQFVFHGILFIEENYALFLLKIFLKNPLDFVWTRRKKIEAIWSFFSVFFCMNNSEMRQILYILRRFSFVPSEIRLVVYAGSVHSPSMEGKTPQECLKPKVSRLKMIAARH